MSQVVNVNFKLDSKIKKSMEQACSEMGLSLTAAFTIYAIKVAKERRIPFEVSADPFNSPSNIRYLEKKMEEYLAGKLKTEEHECCQNIKVDESDAEEIDRLFEKMSPEAIKYMTGTGTEPWVYEEYREYLKKNGKEEWL